MGNQLDSIFSKNTVRANPLSELEAPLVAMIGFVTWVFDMTAEHLPNEEAVERRAKAWLKLLTPAFFRPEINYVVQVCCRLRGDRRDAIKADEILRVAEKVYGCPVTAWHIPNAGDPQVWSIKDNDWIPLEQMLDRIWHARNKGDEREMPQAEWLAEFEKARPELLKLIYGGE